MKWLRETNCAKENKERQNGLKRTIRNYKMNLDKALGRFEPEMNVVELRFNEPRSVRQKMKGRC